MSSQTTTHYYKCFGAIILDFIIILKNMSDEDEIELKKKKSEAPPPRRRPKMIVIPRRAPSIVIPELRPVFITPDKMTCVECNCFPKEDPYRKPKKLNQCQQSPLTLYELAVAVVDGLRCPAAFFWSEDDVAQWCDGLLPQYRDCMLENHINGMKLLMLEDPSKLPQINIHNFEHIQLITARVRSEFGMDFIRFCRSIGLPPRRPLVHCTWFESRTGPSWGIRKNWTRGDILRWMKILMPAPVYRDHWELVWYQKPDFPSVKFARVSKQHLPVHIPRYKEPVEGLCKEYQLPRKFKFQTGIPDDEQMIWLEHRPGSPLKEDIQEEKKKKEKMKKKREVEFLISDRSRLYPEKVSCEGLSGDRLILARRKMSKPKFLP